MRQLQIGSFVRKATLPAITEIRSAVYKGRLFNLFPEAGAYAATARPELAIWENNVLIEAYMRNPQDYSSKTDFSLSI